MRGPRTGPAGPVWGMARAALYREEARRLQLENDREERGAGQ